MQDLKQAYEELKEKYRSAQDQIRARDYDIIKYRLARDAVNIALWEMDFAGEDIESPENVLIWSRELRNMLGFSDERDFPDVLQSLTDRLHPEDYSRTKALFDAHINDVTGKTPFSTEHRLQLKTGEYRHFHSQVNTLRDSEGKPVRIAGAIRDITEKTTQNATEKSDRTLNTVTDVLNQPAVMIYAVDPDTDEVLFMTDSMKQHFGIEGNVTGQTCYRLLQYNMTSRCGFCPGYQLEQKPGTTQILEAGRLGTGSYYQITGQDTAWPDGRKVRIQSVTGLTGTWREQETLEHRENLAAALDQMDLILLSQKGKTFEEVLSESLRPIASVAKLDRIDIYNFVDSDGMPRLGQVYRWTKSESGLTLPDENLKVVPALPVTENWTGKLKKGEYVNVHAGTMTADEFAFLSTLSIQSLLLVPVNINDGFWGAVAFQDFSDARLFDEDSIRFLTSAAHYCADAIIRNQIKQELAQTDERMALLLDSAPFYCQLWDSDFRKIDCNSEALRLFGFPDKAAFLKKYLTLYPEYQPDGELSTEKVARHLKKALDEGSCRFDWTYRMLDGTLMPTVNIFVKVKYGDSFAIAGYTRDLREQNRHEEELRRAHELNKLQLTKLNLMVKATRIGLWDAEWEKGKVIDPANVFNWSDDLRQMLGFTDENDFPNVLGSWSSRLHPEDGTRIRDAFAAHLADTSGATGYDTEFRVMKKDGEYGYFRSAGAAIRDENGIPVRVAGALIDITEMKEMTLALNDAVQESQKTIDIMSSILNSTTAMIYVSDRESFELLFVNDYMKEHFGLSDDVVGQDCYRVLYEDQNEKCAWCPVPHLDASQTSVITWENRSRRTNRYYRNTNRYIDWPGGKKVHVQHSVDLTDIKQMQDDLSYSQRMLIAINEAASLLLDSDIGAFESTLHLSMKSLADVLEIDRISIWKNSLIDGQLHYSMISEWSENVRPLYGSLATVNAAFSDALPGWEEVLSAGNCINTLVSDLPPRQRSLLSGQEILSLLVAPVFLGDQFWGFVGFDNCRKEKLFAASEESILKSASVLFVNAFFRHEILASLRDTSTQLEEALEEAKRANQSKGEFLRTVSHEIRTPMNVILGLTELQLQSETLEEETRESFDRIHASADMLLGIINDILDMSIIESGKLEVVPETYDTASLISDTAHTSMIHIGSKPVTFNLHVDENMPTLLFGDALRIKQILNNLLSNAFKYTDSGHINLSFHTESGTHDDGIVNLVFEVSDTGQGMTQDQLGRIFDTYERFNLQVNQSIPGTGLGMSIVKNLLDLMSGHIETESVPDKGSRFTVRLPQTRVGSDVLGAQLVENLQRFDLASHRRMKRVQISREPMPYGRVLIVDDVESNVYVAQGLLKPYGLKIDTALSGQAAVEKIENGREYDIVFMDHMMPRMDGMEATKVLREKGYQQPIVALTANAAIGQSEKFLRNGFDDFISKPIDLRQLNSVLNRLIRDRYLAEAPEVVEAARLEATSIKFAGTPRPRELSPMLIETFIRDASAVIAMLESLASKPGPWPDEDKRMYRTHVHAMKSALTNIGKQDLARIASNLEMSNYDGDIPALRSVNDTFIESLRAEIKEFASKDASGSRRPARMSQTYLVNNLLVIKAACSDYDANTIHATIRQLRESSWSQATLNLLGDITIHLLNSEFAKIADAVDLYLVSALSTS